MFSRNPCSYQFLYPIFQYIYVLEYILFLYLPVLNMFYSFSVLLYWYNVQESIQLAVWILKRYWVLAVCRRRLFVSLISKVALAREWFSSRFSSIQLIIFCIISFHSYKSYTTFHLFLKTVVQYTMRMCFIYNTIILFKMLDLSCEYSISFY